MAASAPSLPGELIPTLMFPQSESLCFQDLTEKLKDWHCALHKKNAPPQSGHNLRLMPHLSGWLSFYSQGCAL